MPPPGIRYVHVSPCLSAPCCERQTRNLSGFFSCSRSLLAVIRMKAGYINLWVSLVVVPAAHSTAVRPTRQIIFRSSLSFRPTPRDFGPGDRDLPFLSSIIFSPSHIALMLLIFPDSSSNTSNSKISNASRRALVL